VSVAFEHLGAFSDLVEQVEALGFKKGRLQPGETLIQRVRELLAVDTVPAQARDVQVHATWTAAGLRCEEVSWSVGYGPRTVGWVLRPEKGAERLPGILALHGHDGVKWYGKEKIADGSTPAGTLVTKLRDELYEGRAFANALAAEGFVVLVHDVFLWGSRRFPFETFPRSIHNLVDLWVASEIRNGRNPDPDERYNFAAWHHEHLVAKYCTIIGTSIPALVSYEDRVAAGYLRNRSDVSDIGCIGLSGGGCRAALLEATCDFIVAAVIVGMMSTYRHLLDHHVEQHTWMFFPPGLSSFADWPDLAACRAPSPLLVQYDRDDQLFALEGMEEADRLIRDHYLRVGRPDAYEGRFYPGPHKFDRAMQVDAFNWLEERLFR
jgi:dienelactone hydrolase